jgi:hypothetical protein
MLLGNIGNHLQDHVVSKRPQSMLHPDFCGNNIQFSLKQQSSDYQKSSTVWNIQDCVNRFWQKIWDCHVSSLLLQHDTCPSLQSSLWLRKKLHTCHIQQIWFHVIYFIFLNAEYSNWMILKKKTEWSNVYSLLLHVRCKQNHVLYTEFYRFLTEEH